jgi:fumarate reductase subunit C
MSADPSYTPHHPKWYRPRMSVWWWLKKWPYTKFVLRELTSVFVAFYALVTLCQIRAVAAGPEAYSRFADRLASPGFFLLNAVAFIAVGFHAVTWFNLAPKAMVVAVRGRRVPDVAIAAANYVAWAVLSGLIAWIVLGG